MRLELTLSEELVEFIDGRFKHLGRQIAILEGKVMASAQDLQAAVASLTQAVTDNTAAVNDEGAKITAEIQRVEAIITAAGSGGINPSDLDAPVQAIKDAVANIQTATAAAAASAAAAAGERP